jgi:hypothetical protein
MCDRWLMVGPAAAFAYQLGSPCCREVSTAVLHAPACGRAVHRRRSVWYLGSAQQRQPLELGSCCTSASLVLLLDRQTATRASQHARGRGVLTWHRHGGVRETSGPCQLLTDGQWKKDACEVLSETHQRTAVVCARDCRDATVIAGTMVTGNCSGRGIALVEHPEHRPWQKVRAKRVHLARFTCKSNTQHAHATPRSTRLLQAAKRHAPLAARNAAHQRSAAQRGRLVRSSGKASAERENALRGLLRRWWPCPAHARDDRIQR